MATARHQRVNKVELARHCNGSGAATARQHRGDCAAPARHYRGYSAALARQRRGNRAASAWQHHGHIVATWSQLRGDGVAPATDATAAKLRGLVEADPHAFEGGAEFEAEVPSLIDAWDVVDVIFDVLFIIDIGLNFGTAGNHIAIT